MAKIGIDARMLGIGHGIGRYVEQLLKGIIQYDTENQYIVFVLDKKESQNAEYYFKSEIINQKLEIVKVGIPWYSLEEQIKFSSIIKQHKIDLMHFPHWNIPLLYNDPYVVTIHDLIMYHYPRPEASTHGSVIYFLKDQAHRVVVNHAVNRAKQIITTSEFTKYDVHQTLGVANEKMKTVYQAVFEMQNAELKMQNKSELLQKFNIIKPYLLYVGTAYPHKNVEGLLRAWSLFLEKYGDNFQLVLVGKDSPFYKKILMQNLKCRMINHKSTINNQQSSIIFTDLVTDDELESLYSSASLFVFPSLYEGFGLPPLEAMQHGVPVISSNRSCLPEILGEGAYFVDPENEDQLASAMHDVLTKEDLRFELKSRAREELKRYSFEKFAQETIEVYKNCISLL